MFGRLTHAILLIATLATIASSPARAAGEDDFTTRIEALRAASYLMPRTTLAQLSELQRIAQPLSAQQQAQVLQVELGAQFWLREPDEGLKLVDRLDRMAAACDDNRLRVDALLNRSYIVSKKIHDAPTARKLVYQANALAATTDDVYLRVKALVSVGLVEAEDGHPEQGLKPIDAAIALARTVNDRDALLLALRARANTQADLNRFDDALATVDALAAAARRRGLPMQLVRALLTENDIASRAGRAARARAALREAVTILATLHADEALPRVLTRLADATIRSGDYAEARRLSDQAWRLAAAAHDADEQSRAEFELALSDIYLGKLLPGQQGAERALAHFRSQETYLPMMLNYGQALAVAGAADAALKVYADAGTISLAAWRKGKERARESVIRAVEMQKKEQENEALNRQNEVRQAELRSERNMKNMWWVLSLACALGCVTSAFLYRRVRVSNRALRTLNGALYRQSTTDALTGLRNRNFFYEYIGTQCADTKEGPGASADCIVDGMFYLLDIDHFKSINDTYGHAVGDTVLREVAGRIASCAGAADLLVRWGGEEFLMFMPGADAARAGAATAALLAAVSAQPVAAGGHVIDVTVSIGFSVSPSACDGLPLTWERHIHIADLALYLAKAEGRHRAYGLTGPQDWTAATLRLVEQDLKQAALAHQVILRSIAGRSAVPEVAAA